jgi:hypothetical protein
MSHLVMERSANGDLPHASLHPVLRYQCPLQLLRVAGEDVLEGAADRAFVVEVELAEAAEDVVIALDELVGRLNSKMEHGLGGV